jgi:hypothetical protein
MTQRKPDRAERVARRLFMAEEKLPWVWNEARATRQVAKLLRQEHDWMRRMVTALPKAKGYVEDLVRREDLLDKLTQRRK